MKKRLILTLLLLIGIVGSYGGNVTSQQEPTTKPKKESAKELKKIKFSQDLEAKLKTGNFQFFAERAYTKISGRNVVDIAGDQYRVDIMDTVVRLQMPYYGTSNTAGYGSRDNPLTFTGPIQNVTLNGKFNDPDGLKLLVRAQNQNAKQCDMIFYIYSDGSARLMINIQGLSSVEFWGYIPEK